MNIIKTLKALGGAVPKNDVRYYLNGVYIKAARDYLEIAVTDGHYIFVVTSTPESINDENINYDLDLGDDHFVEMIIDGQDLRNKLKVFGTKDRVAINISKDHFSLNDINFLMLDGRYPDYRKILLEQDSTEYNFNGEIGLNANLLSIVSKTFVKLFDKDCAFNVDIKNSTSSVMFSAHNKNIKVKALLMPARI